jgi:hypothetical protein
MGNKFHPGETLKEKLQEMEMSIKEFALRIGQGVGELLLQPVVKGCVQGFSARLHQSLRLVGLE